MNFMRKCLFLLVLIAFGPFPVQAAPLLPLKLEGFQPHNSDSYTQGLFILDGRLYESAGLYGRSSFEVRRFEAGRPPDLISSKKLGDRYFAEGATEAGGEIYLLTWREETGFVLDLKTLLIKREFSYSGEGWGLSWDGERLWRSDGSSRLYPHRAGDFAPAGEPVVIYDQDREVERLNELEWDPLTGLMLANIYGEDLVAAIDLSAGRVLFWLDARPLREMAGLAGLVQGRSPLDTVLNGLAVEGQALWLTGKLWPRLYKAAWPPEGSAEILKP